MEGREAGLAEIDAEIEESEKELENIKWGLERHEANCYWSREALDVEGWRSRINTVRQCICFLKLKRKRAAGSVGKLSGRNPTELDSDDGKD